jgi:hypothetical protein
MISLARDAKRRGESSDEMLRHVAMFSKGDFYNGARAIVELASQEGAEERLTAAERDRLIGAYHYLYNERLFNLFDRCHAALWRIFERDGDHANLLNLFRHSSFIWRLSGRDDRETAYLWRLTRNVRSLIGAGFLQSTRDGAYFVVRVTVLLGKFPDDKNDGRSLVPVAS